MLIETSNDKNPLTSLGSSLSVLDPVSTGNGHVPRNIRMSLFAIDLVEPYVGLTAVNDTALSEDVIPLQQRSSQSCRMERAVSVSPTSNLSSIKMDWKVGGALQVDETVLWYAKWDNIPPSLLDCLSQPSMIDILTWFQRGTPVGATNGTTEFSSTIQTTVFLATIDLSSFSPGDEIVVLASARVDHSWSQQPDLFAPHLPPQSHIANVRTNPSWYHESGRNIVQGRLDWFSLPFTVVIGERIELASPTLSPSRMESSIPTTRYRGSFGPSLYDTWLDTGSPTTISPSLRPSRDATLLETVSPISPQSNSRPSLVSPMTLSPSIVGEPNLNAGFPETVGPSSALPSRAPLRTSKSSASDRTASVLGWVLMAILVVV
jgi:hypothetical protein